MFRPLTLNWFKNCIQYPIETNNYETDVYQIKKIIGFQSEIALYVFLADTFISF